MATWDLVKDLNLDLSALKAEQVQTIINNMDSGEIDKIVADLKDEREKNEKLEKYLDLAISIAEIVLTKGVSLV
jgi:hypothetical protein